MRALILAVVLAPAIARADTFVELGGGLDLPAGDDTYKNDVDPSVDLAARIGGGGPDVGGMFSLDWTPLSSHINFVSFQRFRFLGHVFVHHRIAPKVEMSARFGAGIDLIHEATDANVLGIHITGSDTDVGLALELGTGLWFTVGSSGDTQVGVELAIPISKHFSSGNPNNPNDPNDANFDLTSVDVDILGGVRLRL